MALSKKTPLDPTPDLVAGYHLPCRGPGCDRGAGEQVWHDRCSWPLRDLFDTRLAGGCDATADKTPPTPRPV